MFYPSKFFLPLGSLVLVLSCATLMQAQQPNVIVIIVDDAGYADFGFTNATTGKTGFDPFGEGTGANPNQAIPSLTPNLDALAQAGVIMSRAYVAANCQPTRAAVVTGGYQQRVGNENVGNNNFAAGEVFEGVPNDVQTIWDRLKAQGYTTGCVGKWHLGQLPDQMIDGKLVEGNRPEHQGIDEFRGHWHGSRTFRVGNLSNNTAGKTYQNQALREVIVTARDASGNATSFTDTDIEDEVEADSTNHPNNYITESFGTFGVDFIRDHANQASPFMLYQSFTAPHKPWETYSPDYNDPRIQHLRGQGTTNQSATQFARRKVASMMISMDNEIGRMIDAIEDPNGDGDTSDSVKDDTLIIFVNDNGGVSGSDAVTGVDGVDNGPFSSYKGSMLDGGIRVPMFISGAGVTNGGTTFDLPVHGIDIVPTVVAAAGGTIGADELIDGTNLLPFINGADSNRPHEVVLSKWQGSFSVIRAEDSGETFKLVNTQRNPAIVYNNRENNYRLYLTDNDVDESTNLINNAAYADLVRELKRDLTQHESTFDKGRFAILARSIDDDLNGAGSDEGRNIFDHFVFNPSGGTQEWSTNDGWVAKDGIDNVPDSDPGSPGKTMYLSDSFAGAILEFPSSGSQSYVANNNMFRQTGADFMLNKFVFSGDAAGSQNQTIGIEGNPLVFTNDLEGNSTEISIDANQSASNLLLYTISNEIQLFDNLAISGDGDAEVVIEGNIRDFYSEVSVDFDPASRHSLDPAFGPRGLIKSGTSKVTLTAANQYSGSTVIEEGTLAVSGTGRIDNSQEIDVKEGAVFDASGRTTGSLNLGNGQKLTGSGDVMGALVADPGATIAPGTGIGVLSLDSNLGFGTGARLEIEISSGGVAGVDYDQLSISGGVFVSGGELIVSVEPGAAISGGDEFQIIEAGSFFGLNFDNIVLPNLPNGLEWNMDTFASTGRLQVDSSLLGDFDQDGDVDLADLDQYIGNLAAPPTGALQLLDLDNDGDIDSDDFMQHYLQLVETSNGGKGTFAGDANLDGTVDVLNDAFTLIANLGNMSATSWSQGDFNADGKVDVLGDAFALVANLGQDNGGA